MTVFSAPDYPQFQPTNEDRFNNLGAVAVLTGSRDSFTAPEMVEYPAVPRPQVSCSACPASAEEAHRPGKPISSIGHGHYLVLCFIFCSACRHYVPFS